MALFFTRHFWRKVILAGLICGLLDITAALLSYFIRTHKNPERVFRFIASGIFGKKALATENIYIIWGALLHFFIAFSFSLFFFLVLPYIKRRLGNWIIRGILYGLFAWAIMNLVVLPLSATPPVPFQWKNTILSAFYLVIAIGLPLSWMGRRYGTVDVRA